MVAAGLDWVVAAGVGVWVVGVDCAAPGVAAEGGVAGFDVVAGVTAAVGAVGAPAVAFAAVGAVCATCVAWAPARSARVVDGAGEFEGDCAPGAAGVDAVAVAVLAASADGCAGGRFVACATAAAMPAASVAACVGWSV